MAGGLFQRLTIWTQLETLTAQSLNAEFDNIINNLSPGEIASIAQTVTQMQIQLNPGGLGTEILAQNDEQDIEQLRFVIARLMGTTYWYQAPALTISEINNLLVLGVGIQTNRVVSGKQDAYDQPQFLLAAGTSLGVTLEASPTSIFTYVVDGVTVTVSANIVVTGLSPAPASNNTATINNALIVNDMYAGQDNADINQISITGAGSAITAQIGSWAAFKVVDSGNTEYFFGFVQDANTIVHVYRGYYFDSSSNPIVRIPINNGDTITIMKLTWLFGALSGTAINVCYTNPVVSTIAPVSPAVGDYWFDLIAGYWKTFNGTAYVNANATFIGTCIQNTTECVGTRSNDFFAVYNSLNTVGLKQNSTSGAIGTSGYSQISVAGNILRYAPYSLQWNAPANLDVGVTIQANTKYYFYITDTGATIISDQFPYDRNADLLGLYHPYKPWRCVGETITNVSSNFVICGDYIANYVSAMNLLGTDTFATNNQQQVLYDTAYYDPDNLASPWNGTSGGTIMIPRKGIYEVGFSLAFSGLGLSTAYGIVNDTPVVTGTPVPIIQDDGTGSGATGSITVANVRTIKCECGDIIEVQAAQFSSGNLNVLNEPNTWLQIKSLPVTRR